MCHLPDGYGGGVSMDHTGRAPSPANGMGRAATSRLMRSSSATLHFSRSVAGAAGAVIAEATGARFFRLAADLQPGRSTRMGARPVPGRAPKPPARNRKRTGPEQDGGGGRGANSAVQQDL